MLLCKHTHLRRLDLQRPGLVRDILLHVSGILASKGFIEEFSRCFSIVSLPQTILPLTPAHYIRVFFAVIFSSFLLELDMVGWSLENLIAVTVGPAAHI